MVYMCLLTIFKRAHDIYYIYYIYYILYILYTIHYIPQGPRRKADSTTCARALAAGLLAADRDALAERGLAAGISAEIIATSSYRTKRPSTETEPMI